MTKPPAHYRCPLCGEPLQHLDQGLRCCNGHHFDRAKQGYYNLLPVQFKSSKSPGDNAQMVTARQLFLAAGHYQPLQSALIELVSACLHKTQKPVAHSATLLDIGCGEGYYTNGVATALADQAQVYGFDIAKPAIQIASKTSRQLSCPPHYSVASSKQLPFAQQMADIIYKVFAPVPADQLIHILQPQGYFISVVPGPDHLRQLKQQIYQDVKPHQAETCPAGFQLTDSKRISYPCQLTDPAEIAALADMTPFAWRLSAQRRQQLMSQASFSVDFDFVLNCYQLAPQG